MGIIFTKYIFVKLAIETPSTRLATSTFYYCDKFVSFKSLYTCGHRTVTYPVYTVRVESQCSGRASASDSRLFSESAAPADSVKSAPGPGLGPQPVGRPWPPGA